MKKLLFFVASLVAFSLVNAQTPVTVCDQSLKIGAMGEETFYYGFAEGDQIVFDFEEVNGKELKEIEIVELPSSSKYSAFKTAKVTDKKIYVNQKGVYSFRFKNGAAAGRICNVKIQRIPESPATQKFNTGWKWKTMYDTTYVPYTQDSLVGYDTLLYQVPVKEMYDHSTKVVTLYENSPIQVHAHSIVSNYDPYEFLPIDITSYNVKTEYEENQVISWAFWYTVGQNPKVNTTKELLTDAAEMYTKSQIPIPILSDVAGDVAKFAAGYAVEVVMPTTGDDINYALLKLSDKSKFREGTYHSYALRSGRSKGAQGRYASPAYCNKNYVMCFKNTNDIYQIPIKFNCAITVETKKYRNVMEDKMDVKPRYVTLHKKRMVVNTSQVRTTIE